MSSFQEDLRGALDEALRRIEECRRTGETRLDLSRVQPLAELPAKLFELVHLEELILEGNKLEHLSEDLGRLVNLKVLVIADQLTLTRLPESLGDLTELRELKVAGTGVKRIPDGLCKLSRLRILRINNNSIEALPEDFGRLSNLRTLILRAIYLSSLPENFGNLISLKSLDLTRNALEKIPAQICRLSNLEELTVTSNPLTELPEGIRNLRQLKTLIVSGNNLTNLTDSIGRCASLQTIDASNNLLTTVPPAIGKLKSLKTLNLAKNVISRVPATLGDLPSLESLDLSNNRLRYLPRKLGNLPSLAQCYLTGNPMAVKFAASLDRDGLDRFLREMWQAKPIQRESRLIVVGEGERGKTTIKNALLHGRPLKCDQTHGIDIDCWPVDPPEGSDAHPVDVDIWDFGGQLIYHQVHHLYLRDKSIYLLVFDTRKDLDLKAQIEGWLEAVRTYGKDGPIIFVQNLRGRGATITEDAFRDYKREYQNLIGMVSLPCLPDLNIQCQKAGPNTNGYEGANSEAANMDEPCSCKDCHERGLARLKQMIEQLLFNPRVKDQGRGQELIRVLDLETNEWEVRNELETMGAALDYPVLGRTEAESLCRRNGVDSNAAALLAELHGHGEILAYHDDFSEGLHSRENARQDELYGKVVLRPAWAKDAIYKVFGSDRIKKNGLLHRDDIASLWGERPDRYPRESYNYLLALVENFQLGYSHRSLYVFPYFLSTSKPAEAVFDVTDSTRLEFHYKKFFHVSLMSRLIVRLHRDLAAVGGKELCWKHGAVLVLRQTGVDHRAANREEARALVEYHKNFRITVQVTGPRRVDLIERIRAGLKDVHGEEVVAEEYVPCPCSHCRGSDDPHMYRLDGMRRILYTGSGGDYTVRCDKGDCEKVDVRIILNGSVSETPSSRAEDANRSGRMARPSVKKDADFIKNIEAKIAWYLKNVDPYAKAKVIAKDLGIAVGTLYNCDNWKNRPVPPFPRRGVRRTKSVRAKGRLHGDMEDKREKVPDSGLETFEELWEGILSIGLEECGKETRKWLEGLSSERQADLVLRIQRAKQELDDPVYEEGSKLIARFIQEQRRLWRR